MQQPWGFGMKKIKVLALLALLAASPVLFGAGSGGFPSRPKFKSITVDVADTTGAVVGLGVINTLDATSNTRILAASYSTNPAVTNRPAAICWGVGVDTTDSSKRWCLRKHGGAGQFETGGNVGSDFQLESFDDTGAHLMYPLIVSRATGTVTFGTSTAGQSGSVQILSDSLGNGGTLALGGTLSSTKACAAGYTRVNPNFCRLDSGGTNVLVAGTDGTCKQTAAIAASNAKAVLGYVRSSVYSAGVAGARSLTVQAHSNATCTNSIFLESYEIYEQAAIAAGTQLTRMFSPTVVLPSNLTGQFYLTESGGSGIADFVVTGYFD